MRHLIFIAVVVLAVLAVLSYGAAFIGHQKRLLTQSEMIRGADDFYKAGKYEEAVNLLSTADKTAPSLRVKVLTARCYAHLPNHKADSRELWQQIEKDAPTSSYMSEAILARASYLYREEHNTSESKKLYVQLLENFPNTEAADEALLALAQIALTENNPTQARMNLEALLQRPVSESRDQAEFLIGDMNMNALYSMDPDPMSQVYVIKQGDAIARLAKQFKVPEDLIIGINKVNPASLRIGQRLKIPTFGALEAVVDKADCSLKLYNNRVFLKRYRVGVGPDDRVKSGKYAVKDKVKAKTPKAPKPVATADGRSPAQPTPTPPPATTENNPLNPTGSKRIDLNRNDVYIHLATNDNILEKRSDVSVISVSSADLDEIYSLLNTGTPVTIIDSKAKKSEEKKS